MFNIMFCKQIKSKISLNIKNRTQKVIAVELLKFFQRDCFLCNKQYWNTKCNLTVTENITSLTQTAGTPRCRLQSRHCPASSDVDYASSVCPHLACHPANHTDRWCLTCLCPNAAAVLLYASDKVYYKLKTEKVHGTMQTATNYTFTP